MLKRIELLIILLFTGISILILEIVTSRIIAPYFGNTIYTFTSIIGVVLTALSFGYFFGGQFADKYPKTKNVYLLIGFAAFWVLLTNSLIHFVMTPLSTMLSFVWGPLLFASLIFFIPTFFLGMLSPLVIKIQINNFPNIGAGKHTGEAFFCSTFGNIIGCLVTGFILVPLIPVPTIVNGTGFLLISITIYGLFKEKTIKLLILSLLTTLSLFLINFLYSEINHPYVIYSTEGVYEKIQVLDSAYKNRPTRFLKQEKHYGSASYLTSDELVFDYTKYYELYKLFKPEAKNFLLMGAGGFSIPKAIINESKEMHVDVCDIEPKLLSIAKDFFFLKPSKQFDFHVSDARYYLNTTKKKYDVIFNDIYLSLFAVPFHCLTQEYFRTNFNSLAEDGLMILNIIANREPDSEQYLNSIRKTVNSVFKNHLIFAVNSKDIKELQNYIILGIKGKKTFDEIQFLSSSTRYLKDIKNHKLDETILDEKKAIIFTDSFAPAEVMLAKVLKHSRK